MRWNAAAAVVGLGIGGPGQAAGLMTTSLDGLVLDAVRDSDIAGSGACCCDPAPAAAIAPPPPPYSCDCEAFAARARPAVQVSWCSMKLSTLPIGCTDQHIRDILLPFIIWKQKKRGNILTSTPTQRR